MQAPCRERRTAKDRRRFSYTSYVPERRSGADRRVRDTRKTTNKVA